MDTFVLLKGIRIYAHHGVDPQETAVGAYFVLNLKLQTDFAHALRTDELAGTVSYADVFEAVRQEMQIPSRLLEHAAGRILHRLFDTFPALSSIELELIKENPPMGADCQGAGIFIAVEREEFANSILPSPHP